MSTPHRSTPEHWATVERYAQQVSSTDDCLLELRSRVEALEAGATCPHSEDSSAHPASSLVEKVALKIAHKGCFLPTDVYGEDARAAIREVATWLEARGLSSGISAARWLLEEVDR